MGEVAFGRRSLIADSYRRPMTADQNSCKGGTTIARSVGDLRCWGLEMFMFPAPNGALHTSWACFDKMDDDVRVPSAPKGHRMPAPKPRRTGMKDWHFLCKCEGPTPPTPSPGC